MSLRILYDEVNLKLGTKKVMFGETNLSQCREINFIYISFYSY